MVARPVIRFHPLAGAALLALGACGQSAQDSGAEQGSIDEVATDGEASVVEEAPALTKQGENETITADEETGIEADDLPQGTPLEDRVATLGLLNKRNNVTVDIELKPGEQTRVEDVIVKLATCERRPPWDTDPETGAFVQVAVRDSSRDENAPFKQVFSGWLFLNSPSLNVVEHPIYDVWVKDCAMRFPGEGPADSSDS